MDRSTQWNVWYLVLAILGVLVLHSYVQQWQQVEPLPYSEFLRELEKGNVKEVAIFPNHIEGTLNQPLPDGRSRFATTRVEIELARDLAQYGVRFTGVVQSTLLRDIFSWVVPALVFFGIWMLIIRRIAAKGGLGGGLGDGLLAIGKSKAKVYVESDTKVTFDDVAGVDEAKEELREIVNFLK
ncbi:MAG: ATP-dependent metallopeptidase FtsH/Yme1/Tma family protein, partial [Hylemonella sp.]